MKILLIGKKGQLGRELYRSLMPLGKLTAVSRFDPGELSVDLCDPQQIRYAIQSVNPELIVNAAAYTDVDRAEKEHLLAYQINTLAPAVMAQEAAKRNTVLIHFSTDYVFDGSGNAPWIETDETEPVNVYGKTKLEGEKRIRESGCRHIIFRTSWVYSAYGKNFVNTILKRALEKKPLHVVNDQFGAPTSAKRLAEITRLVIEQWNDRHKNDLQGTYHVSATGETSWYGFARYIIMKAHEFGILAFLPREKIVPINSAALLSVAQRPLNSRLDTSLFKKVFGIELPSWKEDVEKTLVDIKLKLEKSGVDHFPL